MIEHQGQNSMSEYMPPEEDKYVRKGKYNRSERITLSFYSIQDLLQFGSSEANIRTMNMDFYLYYVCLYTSLTHFNNHYWVFF